MKHKGYTLIEILVVLFIISIVSSVALLSINWNENKQMASFADELTQIMRLAEEQAMLEPNVLGLAFTQQAFQFVSLQSVGDKKHSWLPVDDTVLNKHDIPSNMQVNIKVAGTQTITNKDAAAINPQIIISTNGEITPFTIYVGKKGKKPCYVITGDADGNITNQSL